MRARICTSMNTPNTTATGQPTAPTPARMPATSKPAIVVAPMPRAELP
jgi:hypothetical protein